MAALHVDPARSGLADILVEIVDARRRRVDQALAAAAGAADTPSIDSAPEVLTAETNRFLSGLEAQRGRAVIAEVKMGSPSLGSLEGRFDPVAQARTYAAHGAAALSVVVEPDYFFGSYELLRRCVDASGLPAIAKEFVVDPVQLRWAQDAGASAVLLIAALYDAATLRSLAVEARRLGLVPLVEVHDTDELARLEGSTWELVGVNNRDLRTFRVDLDTSRALLPLLPTGALCVAESGIHRGDDLRSLAVAGFDAFLIGESLLLADDPAAKLQELRGA